MSASCLLRVEWAEATRELATAEAVALGARPGPGPGLFFVDALPPAGRGGFVLEGGEVVAEGPPGGPVAPVVADAAEVSVPKGPWRKGGNALDQLAQLGWRARYVTPHGAGYVLYTTESGWLLVRSPGPLAWTEPVLAHRTSTSLPSRLARAVVNLVARPGDRVLDPVCGAGVLLVEAARLGCEVEGGDLSPKAAAWARRNLAGLDLRGRVEVRDALTRPPGDADVVVGDLPYGLRLAPTDLRPFAEALPRLGRRWALVAHEDLSPYLERPVVVLRVPKSTFTRYVHIGE